MGFSLHEHLRGIHLLQSIFSWMLKILWNSARNAANSQLQLPSTLSFPCGLSFQQINTRGGEAAPAASEGHRHEGVHAGPLGASSISWFLHLPTKYTYVCQHFWRIILIFACSNRLIKHLTLSRWKNNWDQTEKIEPETWNEWISPLTFFGTEWGLY